MSQNTIRNIILLHFVVLCIIGFFFYDTTTVFYIGVQIASVLIYVVSMYPLSKRNKVLIQGLILMTALETIDYVYKANTYDPTDLKHVKERLLRDAVIVGACSILTMIRYLRCPKYTMQS